MVGRFVQHEQVGLQVGQLRQNQLVLFAAGEIFGLPEHVVARKQKPSQVRARIRRLHVGHVQHVVQNGRFQVQIARVLREIANGDAGAQPRHARRRRFPIQQNFYQRRFARAVRPDDAHALTAPDQTRYVLEQRARARTAWSRCPESRSRCRSAASA